MTDEILNSKNVDKPTRTHITIRVSGILGDMDGTLIDSTEAVVKFWKSVQYRSELWTVATSATRPVVEGWFQVLNLPLPANMVTAESLTHGKPHPDPYIQGMERFNLEGQPSNCFLVLGDAPARVKAGKETGCLVLALATTHSAEDLRSAGADWIIPDLRSVRLANTQREDSLIVLRFRIIQPGSRGSNKG